MNKSEIESTLFVSDLDGTLLNENAELSEHSANLLNELISKGVNFTIATARTIESVKRIMSKVNLTLPAVLMNGVLIRSMSSGQYINAELLSAEEYNFITKSLDSLGLTAFAYTLNDDGSMMTHYSELANQFMLDFYTERRIKFDKPFKKLNQLNDILQGNADLGSPFYVVALDTRSRLEPMYRIIEKTPNLSCAFYTDNYTKSHCYLEIFSCRASKKHAVEYLRRTLPFKKIVCFGDNTNDLPMFSASDECYAVSNATDEVKNAADGIIDTNQNNGVIKFISELL